MRILEQKTDIGRCIICKGKVTTDDSVWYNKVSVMYKEKIICGICLVNLNGASIEAMKNVEMDEKSSISPEQMMAKWGVYVDPDTGKMVSKGIKKAKA